MVGFPIRRFPSNVRGNRIGWKPERGNAVDYLALLILALVWMAASAGTGFLLALLARRIHPSLSMVRLWFFYTILMAVLAAVVLLVGWW